jgi:hypothetical protein
VSGATFVAVARLLLRAGVVLCLALAALALAVGEAEYPGYTRPAFRVMLAEVLPLVGVAALGLAALDAGGRVGRWARVLAPVASVALLAVALPDARPGSPPFAFLRAGIAALLAVTSVAAVVLHHRDVRRG